MKALFLTLNMLYSAVSLGAELKQAPDFSLKDQQGKVHRLSDFRGKETLLHFWASWCPPCLEEISEWLELARRKKTIFFVAISQDASWSEIEKKMGGNFLHDRIPENVVLLLDSSGKISEKFGTFQLPESYLITQELKIKTKWVGPQNWPKVWSQK